MGWSVGALRTGQGTVDVVWGDWRRGLKGDAFRLLKR